MQVATASSKLHTISMHDGRAAAVDAATHGQPITSLAPNAHLQHVVSCSLDGTLKLWNSGRALSRTLLIGQQLSCACFLDSDGDLVVGIDHKVILIRAAMYRKVMDTEKDGRGAMRCERGRALRLNLCDSARSHNLRACATVWTQTDHRFAVTVGRESVVFHCTCRMVERDILDVYRGAARLPVEWTRAEESPLCAASSLRRPPSMSGA